MMQSTNVTNFLLSLASAISLRSSLVFTCDGPTEPRSLWVDELQQKLATDPATSLTVYGGQFPAGLIVRPTLSLQQMTLGTQSPAVIAQAWLVHQAMLSDDGQPQTQWTIPGKRKNEQTKAIEDDPERDWEVKLAMPRQRPGLIGRDPDTDMWMASGNWDIEFFEKAKV